jgi:hypothetical protein
MTGFRLPWLATLAVIALLPPGAAAQPAGYGFDNAAHFLKTYCQACHQGTSPAGDFALQRVEAAESLRTENARWNEMALRVRNGEMPPKGAPAPPAVEREQFEQWVTSALRTAACAAGPIAASSPLRRLNREEYAATIRDLLDIQMDLSSVLPADGAGGEGFDNAAETLFLSPLHSEKYMEAARIAVDYAAREYKSREKIFVVNPGDGISPEQAAREILKSFLPRAFRRPVAEDDLSHYLALFRAARRQGNDFEPAVLFTIRAALVSPRFLFLSEPPNHTRDLRRLDPLSLASRISYFLWGSMADELLVDIAGAGSLHEPQVVQALIPRMLRNERALDFAKRFVDQWLRTREMDSDKAPDLQLFPAWASDEDLRSDIRLQPALFFHEILKRDLSVLSLIDSTHTVLTRKLARHFGEPVQITANALQPQWIELPKGSTRGGVLGMPGVLAVSSYPYRTSPVLRGAWVMDSMLGTPPPPAPPGVPPLEKQASQEAPKTVREMLTLHRADPTCASCHSRIDPLGFTLENYDPVGRWREQDAGKPIDSTGELPDGTLVQGPQGLKQALLDRKDLFVRNLTRKMLGYALGRGLTPAESCTVDRIAEELKLHDYRAQKLVELIILSVPFQYQAPVERASAAGRSGRD